MNKYLTLLLILCFYQLKSQTESIPQNIELNIQTKFNQYGGLFETSSRNSPMIAQFNKGQKCLVKTYLGSNKFKIEYKKLVGYVTSDYLVINDELENAIKNHEETKINIENQTKAEEQSITAAAENKTKVDEEEKIKLFDETKAKADEEERIRVVAENKAKAEEVDIINGRTNKLNQTNFIQQNREFNIQTKFKQYGALYETSTPNSEVNAQFNKGQKCIVKSYLGNNKFKIEYKKWVGYVTSEYLVITDELVDAIKKYEEYLTIEIKKEEIEVVQQELNIVESQKKNVELGPIENELYQLGNVEKNQVESKINQQNVDLERIEFRFTCHYQMNEIDDFYNEKIIKTENYIVNDNLKIELYRIGNKKHVFINFDSQLGCASYFSHSRSYAKIKLENNTVVTIYHSWNVDCANFSLKGILTNSSISKLKESPIKSIKLQGTKGFIEIENVKYKEFFMDKLNCLD